MAEIRVDQKRSVKWMYLVATILVIVAVWFFVARPAGPTSGDLDPTGAVGQDSVGATMPPPPPPQ